MSVLAALTALGLYLLDVPYWLTFGIFTGLVAIVPFFGTLLSTTVPALFVLSGPNGGTRALYVILLGVIVHLIEGNIVSPLVMSKPPSTWVSCSTRADRRSQNTGIGRLPTPDMCNRQFAWAAYWRHRTRPRPNTGGGERLTKGTGRRPTT